MRWFNNVRMAPKLIGSFVLVALLAIVVGSTALAGFGSVQSKID